MTEPRSSEISPPKLVYIMAEVRSGSTALCILLGNSPMVESVGELARWPAFRGRPKHDNEKPDDYAFWNSVRNVYHAEAGEPDFAALLDVQGKAEGYGAILLTLLGPIDQLTRDAYRAHVRRLLAAIQSVSGKSIVVDSSKRMGRAWMLFQCMPRETQIIHLVRDPRATLWSQLKRGVEQSPRPPVRAMLQYSFKNLMAEIVRWRLPRHAVLRVRYEDLAERPAAQLRRIGSFLDLPVGQLAVALEKGTALRVPHLIDGNRVRREAMIKFTLDDEWRSALRMWQRLLAVVLTLPFFVLYGYHRHDKS